MKKYFKKLLSLCLICLMLIPTIISFAGAPGVPDYSADPYRFAVKKVWDDDNDKYNKRPDSLDFKVCYFKQIDEENCYFIDFEKIPYDEDYLKKATWNPNTRLLTLKDGTTGIPVMYVDNPDPDFWYLLKVEKDSFDNIDNYTHTFTVYEEGKEIHNQIQDWIGYYYPFTMFHYITGDSFSDGYDLIKSTYDTTLPDSSEYEYKDFINFFFDGYKKYIKEVVPDGYSVTQEYIISDIDSNVFIFVNKYEGNYNLEINKTWNDDNNRDGIRPDEITLIGYECYKYEDKYYYFNYDDSYIYLNIPFGTDYDIGNNKTLYKSAFNFDEELNGYDNYYLILAEDINLSQSDISFGRNVVKPCVLVSDKSYNELTDEEKALIHTYEITVNNNENWTKTTKCYWNINMFSEKPVSGYTINEGD